MTALMLLLAPLMLLLAPLTPSVVAQPSEPIASLLLRFDNEHNLAGKERLLLTVTDQGAGVDSALLGLAQSTKNSDTRWMAMRGMVTLRCTACAPFLETSLQDSDVLVRANAARALGDLRIKTAAIPLLAMFAAEREPPAVEQASLALRMLNIKAAAPYVREKIPLFTRQTRLWLIQALGTVGSSADVPFIAGYLDEKMSDMAATEALQELAGVNFGPPSRGASAVSTPETLAARAWWKSHRDAWPRCDDCHLK